MKDAVEMALWLKKWGYQPEQVQDFYPTPGTISTVMYYTGIHPMTGKSVSVTTDYREKQLQRALLQYARPENAPLVREALTVAGREDLIGTSPDCLVRPSFGQRSGSFERPKGKRTAQHPTDTRRKSKSTAGYHRPDTPKKRTKMDRIFGEEASRIRREADALTKSGTKVKNGRKITKKR